MWRLLPTGLLLLLLFVAVSCRPPGLELSGRQSLPFPVNDYIFVEWVDGHLIAAAQSLDPPRGPLRFVHLGQQFLLPMYDCHRSQVMSVEQRGEAVRAAFRCQREGGVEVRIQLAEFDRDGLRWIAFGPAIEPGDPSGASWRSDGGLATTDNDGILSGYLLFVDADSAVRADVDFQMTQYGIWSPAADRLVFNGRRTPTLGPITAGAQTAWYLWEQPPHGPIRQLRGGLVSVSRPAWSPSGKCIVFSEGEGSRQSLTIMAASDGRTVAWARGAFGRPAWSPDGRQVAAPRTLTTDPLSTERELVLFDLPESVSDQC